jgi:CheY-like chemotaxis protein
MPLKAWALGGESGMDHRRRGQGLGLAKGARQVDAMVDQGLVLIADGREPERSPLRRFLEGAGYIVDSAMNSEEAVDKVDAVRPDLLIVDLTAAEIDATTIVREIQRRLGAPPVVLLTGPEEVGDKRSAVPGVAATVRRPFTPDALAGICRALAPASPSMS